MKTVEDLIEKLKKLPKDSEIYGEGRQVDLVIKHKDKARADDYESFEGF